jgi:eukaryotic-like serine/threonine-protein kinase
VTALRSTSSEQPRLLGRYELLAEVAKSQLGPLSAARGSAADDLALIRTVSTGPAVASDELDRLSEAAWWALEVSHTHIAAPRDVVMTEQQIGLVSEYVEGEVLRSLMRVAGFRRTAIPAPVALRIVLDVLDALDFACQEAQGVEGTTYVYGGLVPDSVLVGANGTTRLLDLGVAGVLAGLKPGHHPELAGYAAPERLETSSALERSDVFSAAVILWELLAGRRLFAGSTFDAVAEKIRRGNVPRLDGKTASNPVATPLADVVARALEPDPAARPASAGEFAEALRGAANDVASPAAVGSLVDTLAGGTLGTRRKLFERPLGGAAPKTAPPEPERAAKAPLSEAPRKVSTFPPQVALRRAPKPTLLGIAPPPPVPSTFRDEPEPESLDSVDIQVVRPPPKPRLRKRNADDADTSTNEVDVDVDVAASSADTEVTSAAATRAAAVAKPVPGVEKPAPAKPVPSVAAHAPEADAAKPVPSVAKPVPAAAAKPVPSVAAHAPEADAARPAFDSMATEAPLPAEARQRTARARKWVAIAVGAMVLLLAAGLVASRLRKPKTASQAARSSLASSPATAPTQSAAVAAQPVPSAAPPPAPSAEPANSAEAASSAEPANSAATSATSAAPPAHATQQPAQHYYRAPPRRHARPKHAFTPQGI